MNKASTKRRNRALLTLGINPVPDKSWKGKAFFLSRSLEKWIEKLRGNKILRLEGLPYILEVWIIKGVITQKEYTSLIQLLSSPDEENWMVAITIMRVKAKKKKDENSTRNLYQGSE